MAGKVELLQMPSLPKHRICVFGSDDRLGDEVECFFRQELAYSREPLDDDRPDRNDWRFVSICAIADTGEVLGGVHMDVGPMNFGPLKSENIAFVEAVRVRPEYRRAGLGTRLLTKALEAAAALGCVHARCNVSWDNQGGIALYRKCGFALADISEDETAAPDKAEEYFVIRPLRR